MAAAAAATAGLIAAAVLILGLDIETRVNISGISGPVLCGSFGWSLVRYLKRRQNGRNL